MSEVRAGQFMFSGDPDAVPVDWEQEPMIDRHAIRLILQISPNHVGTLTRDFHGFSVGSAVVCERIAADEQFFVIEFPLDMA